MQTVAATCSRGHFSQMYQTGQSRSLQFDVPPGRGHISRSNMEIVRWRSCPSSRRGHFSLDSRSRGHIGLYSMYKNIYEVRRNVL